MNLDMDDIAEEAVGEVFGFRAGPRPVVRLARAINRANNYRRAGWGSPAWQAAQAAASYDAGSGGSYATGGGGGVDDAAIEGMIDEEMGPEQGFDGGDGYGYEPDDDFGEDEYGDEEYGVDEYGKYYKKWYETKHPLRVHRRRQLKRAMGLPPERGTIRHEIAELRSEGKWPPASSPPTYAPGSIGAASHSFGFDGDIPEPSRSNLIVDSAKIGLGVGLGLAAVSIGMHVLGRVIR